MVSWKCPCNNAVKLLGNVTFDGSIKRGIVSSNIALPVSAVGRGSPSLWVDILQHVVITCLFESLLVVRFNTVKFMFSRGQSGESSIDRVGNSIDRCGRVGA